MLNLPVVSQQQQSLTIPIQPPDRINLGDINKIFQRATTIFITKLAQHIKGFVEQNYLSLRKRDFRLRNTAKMNRTLCWFFPFLGFSPKRCWLHKQGIHKNFAYFSTN